MKQTATTAKEPALTRLRRSVIRFGRRDKSIYLLVFLVPVLVMYAAYALFGVHPFGKGSALVLDLNGQYVYYYENMRDAFWGEGSFIYDWSRNLSGEMFGIFGYYLASPFMLVICLFPRNAMCGAIETMQLLKMGTAAVTFVFFLRKHYKPSRTAQVIFGSCYGLMSYMIVQLMDPMWLDGLIYLPLICHGAHRLIEEGKMAPYIVPLALMFIAHFYIGYMVGFFTFIYFIYICLSKEGRILPKHFLLRTLQAIAGTVIAIMCAAVVLIPVYNSLKLGKLEFSTPNWELATQFDFLTLFTKLFPMSYDTVNVEGMPMIYVGCISLMLIPLFFLNSKIGIKEKVSKGLLAFTLIICMYIKPIDTVWHGFQVPNWLNFRYSFCLSFVLLLMAYRAFENCDGFTVKELGGVFFGLFVFLIWCEREQYAHFTIFEGRTTQGVTHGVMQGVWFSGIAIGIYFLLIYLWKKYRAKRILAVIMCVAVPLELLVNAMDTLHKIDVDVVYSKYTSYEPYMSDTRDAVENLYRFDKDEFYRVEATFHRTVNDPIGTNYKGISHSSSTMNATVLTMLKKLGYAYGGHYVKYDGETILTDSLFGIRYIMDKQDNKGGNHNKDNRAVIPAEYKLATHIQETEAKYLFYRNPYDLSLGTVTSDKLLNVTLGEHNPFENQNLVYNALLSPESETEFFTRITPYKTDSENLARVGLTDGCTKYYYKNESYPECHIDYLVRMDKDSDLYMHLPTLHEHSCNVWYQLEREYVDGANNMSFAGQFFVGDNYSVMNIGRFHEGDEVRIRITIANDEKEGVWLDELFYTVDTEAFAEAAAQLQARGWQLTEFEDTFLSGTCTAGANEYLFTTIPYEEGWLITVNGKDVKPEKSLDSLIMIPLEEGENTVEMEFSPNYFKLGIIVSIVGLLILLLIGFVEYKNGKLLHRLFVKAEFREKPEPKAPRAIIPDHDGDDSE
ncbi:MAG: YfhO family protein [Ruminococcus sp.]|nr:YfhO family protein [Ruminococcus sp.]